MDDVQRAANKANEIGRQSLGQYGAIASDGEVTGNFVAIQIISDATILDVLETNSNSDFSILIGQSFPAGTILYGPFVRVSSTGGTFIAYKA